jgi:hypothetical protein
MKEILKELNIGYEISIEYEAIDLEEIGNAYILIYIDTDKIDQHKTFEAMMASKNPDHRYLLGHAASDEVEGELLFVYTKGTAQYTDLVNIDKDSTIKSRMTNFLMEKAAWKLHR